MAHPVLDRTFAAVLFDLDGTLISSVAAAERSWTRLAIELAIPAERFGDFHGVPSAQLIERLIPERPEAERRYAEQRIEEIEVADTAGIELLPGAADALAALRPAGRCAIVTSCTRALAAARLGASGLPVPGVVVTVDDVARGKPAPDPFLLGAERLDVDPTHCLVVEDATAGIVAARAAGAATLALATTSPVDRIDGDLVVRDLAAVRFEVSPGGVRVRLA